MNPGVNISFNHVEILKKFINKYLTMKNLILALAMLTASIGYSQISPDLYSWKINLNGATGYNGIPADVQQIRYSANFTYVSSSGIPSYTIGPWAMNPNLASNQNWTFKIARYPVADPTPATAGNGQIGVLKNGVVLFNPGDAMSYNNQNIWHRVAQYFEAVSFDTSGGHPAPGGVYHYHINMKKLYTPNASEHSPILGYMFDGFPLYGPYAYSNTNGTGGIRRMKSGYKKRNITTRTTLPNGTVLPPNQYGPAVSSSYPLGCFIEDYELSASGTDLDSHNGRFSITPDYPSGIYAYFIALDSLSNPEFPYIIGNTFYGEVVAGNTGPGGGHITITEPVNQFAPKYLTLNALLQGFYDENTNSMITDTLRVYLRSSISPYSIVDSAKANSNSSGTGSFIFANASNNTPYYLQIKHRNTVETWSSVAVSFVNSVMSYDFTPAAGKAFGNNMKQVDSSPLKFAAYSGDVNQDGTIEASDLSAIDNAVFGFATGYISTDINGDGTVDASDASITENNAFNYVGRITPLSLESDGGLMINP